jgi:hypothetical protein
VLTFGVVEGLPEGYHYNGSTLLQALYQSDSVEDGLGNLATRLTNHIRQSGSSATKKEEWLGAIYTDAVFVKVGDFV